jgi:hypothetical protein
MTVESALVDLAAIRPIGVQVSVSADSAGCRCR